MLSIYEWLFGKEQPDGVALTEEKIKQDCSGLQDFTQPFCRQTIGFPISNPQLEEARLKDQKKHERMKLRYNLQSPKPVKPFRIEQPDKPYGNMSYKDVLMR